MVLLTGIRAQRPTRNDVRRTERSLLNLSEDVLDVAVEDNTTERAVREVFGGQSLRGVKDVDRVLLSDLGADDLAIYSSG